MRQTPGFLATRRGKLTLALVCLAAFLDFVDGSIMNMALPAIHRDLRVSVQDVQWVLGGYLVTFGGFLLLGGRAADLLGRRRMLIAGTSLFAVASLAGGFAPSYGIVVAARLAMGVGAALMSPAALSTLTTSFPDSRQRTTALAAWGAMAGLGPAVGVLAGGALTGGPGWRWVFFVTLPASGLLLIGAVKLLDRDARPIVRASSFDAVGAALITAGTLLLLYALVRAPIVGWGAAITIVELSAACALLVAFVINESRQDSPLVPLSIFRIPGVAAADATNAIAMAGLYSMFFFITLYMEDILRLSPIHAGLGYVPVNIGVGSSSVVAAKLVPRLGTRPVIASGCAISGIGILWISRIPVHGTYFSDLLGPLFVMALGFGTVIVSVQAAANGGVPADKAGIAAGLINASYQVGSALGIAIFSAIATARTRHLLHTHQAAASAITSGYRWALAACGISLFAAAAIAIRAANVRHDASDATPSIEHLAEVVDDRVGVGQRGI